MMNVPPLDPQARAEIVRRLDPDKVRAAAQRALRRTEERMAANLLPPDLRSAPDPKPTT